jgi:hypothetical protein
MPEASGLCRHASPRAVRERHCPPAEGDACHWGPVAPLAIAAFAAVRTLAGIGTTKATGATASGGAEAA